MLAILGFILSFQLSLLQGGPVLWAMTGSVDADSVASLFGRAWRALDDYECVLESEDVYEGEKKHRVAEYKFKKPGWIFMKIVEGKNKGAQVVYNPGTKKVSACKGGVLSLIKITADPGHKRVMSRKGDRIDESHWGTRAEGGACVLSPCEQRLLGEEIFEGEKTWVIERTTSKPESNKGTAAEKFWIDKRKWVPLRFEERDKEGRLVYWAVYREIRIDTGMDTTFFKL